MRGVQIILLLVVVQVSNCRETHWRKQDYVHNYFDDQGCTQNEPNCEECLSKGGNCEWCSDDSIRSECIRQGSENCPREQRKTTCSTQTAEDEKKATVLEYNDKSLDELQAMADAPPAVDNSSVVTVNASVLCGRQGGCNNCTSHEFCLWCESKQRCQVYFNALASTNEQSCPKQESAYKDQCIYPIGVIPCRERKKSCPTCVQEDGLCYWCSSTAKCERYPSVNYQPDDCPRDKWYVKDCPVINDLMWVLIPILAIILIPVIVYIIIWLVCCCMRAAGYEPLEPAESPKKKHPKGIRLKSGSPSNKTDELRKKYDLNNP